jgi:hypothetical protein
MLKIFSGKALSPVLNAVRWASVQGTTRTATTASVNSLDSFDNQFFQSLSSRNNAYYRFQLISEKFASQQPDSWIKSWFID